MSDFFSSDKSYSARNQENVKNINTFINLIERLKKAEYTDYHYEQLDKEYGKTGFIEEENYLSLKREKETKENEETIRDKISQIADYDDYMHKQDIDYICRLLKKHLVYWWD